MSKSCTLPVPFGRAPHLWDEESVIAAIRRWATEHGKPPGADAWRKSGPWWPCAMTVRQMFGSWTVGIEAAGFSARHSRRAAPPTYSDEDILEAIRRAFAEGERTAEPFRKGHRRPFLAAIIVRFGSWNQAVARAGVLKQQKNYYPQLWDEDWLRREYVERGRGTKSIARQIGCTDSGVYGALVRFGIPRRPPYVHGRVES